MTQELKPCPFCGGTDIRIKRDLTCGFETFSVQCMVCDAPQNYHDSERGAIDAWNTRTERTTPMYRDNHGIWHCENCEHGADIWTGSNGALDAWEDSWAPNYCPNCGAKVVDRSAEQWT